MINQTIINNTGTCTLIECFKTHWGDLTIYLTIFSICELILIIFLVKIIFSLIKKLHIGGINDR